MRLREISFSAVLWAALGACSPPPEPADAGRVRDVGLTMIDGSAADARPGEAGAGDAAPDRAGGDAGRADAGATDLSQRDHILGEPNPTHPDNANRDSDCDGLSDAEEYGNTYANGAQTDPADPDSDDDGLLDGVELGRTTSPDPRCDFFSGDRDPGQTTQPLSPDTDGDGLLDGEEDANHDGAYQPGQELDPRHPDTDQDGLCDGANDVVGVCAGGDPNPYLAVSDRDLDGVPDVHDRAPDAPDADGDGLCDGPRDLAGVCVGGEDLNGDGALGVGESDPGLVDTDCDGVSDGDERRHGTDPRSRDSDGDLVSDGVELGVTQPLEAERCGAVAADLDPASTTDPRAADSDGDGINDGIEDANRNGRVDSGETDPTSADSDGDGLCDGPARQIDGVCSGGEDLNANGVSDPGESDPRVPANPDGDTDGDGLPDLLEENVRCLGVNDPDSDDDGLCDGPLAVSGVCRPGEDLDRDGQVDPEETDPCDIDSDCDGLIDGPDHPPYLGEESFGTSPTVPDSDGDGLTDGLEAGIVGDAVPPGTSAACGFVADADATTRTDPLNADSDGDGIWDGAEDANQNGRVDPGEMRPDQRDADRTALAACGSTNLVALDFSMAARPDLLLASADLGAGDTFTDRVVLELSGEPVGVMLFNPNRQIAAFAVSLVPGPDDTTAAQAELRRRPVIGGLAGTVLTSFTTWDGFGGSVLVSYDDAATTSLKQRASQIVERLLGARPENALTSGGEPGPFSLRMEYVRRSDQRLVVAGALMPSARYRDSAVFRLEDLANGSALAQFGDGVGTQCDLFDVSDEAAVDFLWVVDNSRSMLAEQAAVAQATSEMVRQLQRSTLDWRLAAITTDIGVGLVEDWESLYLYREGQSYPANECAETYPPYWPTLCGFTRDPEFFAGCVSSFYICGWGFESAFGALACVTGAEVGGAHWCLGRGPVAQPPPEAYSLLPRAEDDPFKLRDRALLAVVLLSDEPDNADARFFPQTSVEQWVDFFQDFDGQGGRAFVAGILCPDGQNCACDTDAGCTPSDARYASVLQALQGIEGDISDPATFPDTIAQIIDAVAGYASPYHLSKAPISSTIRVALGGATAGPCNHDAVPRSREHGWDFDGATGNISFYGDCRPTTASPPPRVAVSYRYWIDRTPDPGGPAEGCDCDPPQQCNPVTLQCYCPPDCGQGLVSPRQVCDTGTCSLVCRPDCGAACPGSSACDPSTCSCVCPADCGGPAPGDAFDCDTDPSSATYCNYVCARCPGSPPNAQMVCDLRTCTWRCPACDTCPGLATCDPASCACACELQMSCADGYRWDAERCDCTCDLGALGCDERYSPDAAICGCVCQPQCGGSCGANMICNQSLCACFPLGG